MSDVVGDIVEIITSGLVDYAKGFGAGLKAAIESIFLDITVAESGATTINGLSTTGGVIVVFAALALAIGLTQLVFNWVTNLGK